VTQSRPVVLASWVATSRLRQISVRPKMYLILNSNFNNISKEKSKRISRNVGTVTLLSFLLEFFHCVDQKGGSEGKMYLCKQNNKNTLKGRKIDQRYQ
jgi:hypothetical protein